jgi:hypothetical protein
MKYDAATLTRLSEDLKGLHGERSQHAAELESAAKTLQTAWEHNDGLEGFNAAYGKFTSAYGQEGDTSPDTAIGKIDKLSKAVHEALLNAQHADKGVAQGFGG